MPSSRLTLTCCIALSLVLASGASPALAAPKGKKKPAVELPQPTPEELKQIRWYVGQLGGNKHEFVRAQACEALAKFGPKAEMAVRALSNAAKDRTKRIAGAACNALGKIGVGSKPARKALIGALKHKEAEVRAMAAAALGDLAPESIDALKPLLELLKDEEAEVRAAAIPALGKLGPEASKLAGPSLEALIEDPDPKVQMLAAVALARMGIQTEAAVPLFTAALEDKRQPLEARKDAADALGRMGPKAKSAVPALLSIATEELKRNPAMPYAAQREKDHTEFRRKAIETLGEIGAGAVQAIETLEGLRDEAALTEAVDAALAKIKAAQPPGDGD